MISKEILMKYLKSFLFFLLISTLILGILSIKNSQTLWEKLPELPSKPVKLKGIYSGVYYNIAVESENGKAYIINDRDLIWVDESVSDFSALHDGANNHLIGACDPNNSKLIDFRKKDIKTVGCYQFHVQYNHDAANLIVILDQDGNVWQNHEWIRPKFSPILIISIFLLSLVLELIFLVFLGIKNIIFRILGKL